MIRMILLNLATVIRLMGGLFALTIALVICVPAVNGAVFQWDGGGANTNWGTAANWVGSAPASTDQNDLEFGTVALQSPGQTTANNNITTDFNLNSIAFGGTAGASFTLTGSSLDWKKHGSTNPSIEQNSNFNHAINMVTKIGGDSLTFTGNGTGLVTLGGNITTGGKPLTKSGTSSYVLTATLSDNHTLTINEGRFALGSGANINASNIQFTGGVLATSGSFTRALGTSAGQVRWAAGGGGFAAYGGALSVDISSATSQTWGASNFVPAGSPLIFGSVIADNVVTYVDAINLGTTGTNTREIRVNDNASSTADLARISGQLTSSGGTQSLNKTGAGTLELTNAAGNTYNGTTTVTAGTLTVTNTSGSGTGSGTLTVNSGAVLNVGNGGAGGSVSGNITDNGTVNFNRSDAATYAGVISGSGAVTKQGAGTLTFTGDHTYGGTTTISAGTLSVGNGSTTGSIADGITNNAALIFNRSNALTHSGAISGTGTLTKLGGGNLTLSNATGNSYGGGTTISAGALTVTNTSGSGTGTGNVTVSGGSLEVGNGGTGGSVSGNIVNNSTVNFNRSDASSYAGQISGSGAVTKNGAGTHTLSGTNTYGGGTTVSAGTLKGHTDSLQGAILNNAAVVFDQGFSGTYGGAMSGSGSMTKDGVGMVTLTAANSYGGGTTINAGTLLVNNSSGSGTGSGAVNVVGGTLGGTGTIAGSVTVQNGGTLSPGASIGTLATGALVFNTGSILNYELQTNAPLAAGADLIDSTGGLNIATGVTLAMFDLAAGFQPSGTKYTIIAYDGAWNGGTFVGVGDDTPFLALGKQWKVNYNDTTPGANFASEALDNASFVTLTVVPEASSVIAMGLTGFCAAAAIYLRKRYGLALFEI